MNQNVGSTDKRVRTALGAVFGIVSLATLAGPVPLPALAAPVLGVASLLMLAARRRHVFGVGGRVAIGSRPTPKHSCSAVNADFLDDYRISVGGSLKCG